MRTRAQRLSALPLFSCAPQSSITRGFAGIPMCGGMLLLLWNAAEKSCCQSTPTHSLLIHTGVKLGGKYCPFVLHFMCAPVQLWFEPLHLYLAVHSLTNISRVLICSTSQCKGHWLTYQRTLFSAKYLFREYGNRSCQHANYSHWILLCNSSIHETMWNTKTLLT